MEHKPALYSLIRLHAELGYRIKANKMEAEKLREDMQHIEAVLQMLEPGFDTRRIAVKRRNNPNPLFKRGTVFRAVLDVLRKAPEPMTAEELALALIHSKGVQEPSAELREHMYGAVNAALVKNAGKTVEAVGERPRRWQILPNVA
jgi:hypothetical protein